MVVHVAETHGRASIYVVHLYLEYRRIAQYIIGNTKKSELSSLIIDSSEVILDSTCNSDIIKKIPVLGYAYKMYSLVSTVRASLFQKQIYAFL